MSQKLLAHTLVEPKTQGPSKGTFVFLHGIFGQGKNLRTLASQWSERTGFTSILVDLRHHGASQDFPPPNTLEACAQDVQVLLQSLQLKPIGIFGHSFGGKVLLELLRLDSKATQNAFVIDSSPSPRPDARGSSSTLEVLDALKKIEGQTFENRKAFAETMLGLGLSRFLTDWLSMNLTFKDERYRFALDVWAMDALLADYFERDLWPSVEDNVRSEASPNYHFVVGTKSNVMGTEDLSKIKELKSSSRVFLHSLNTGHYVHVDDPEGLLNVMQNALSEISESQES